MYAPKKVMLKPKEITKIKKIQAAIKITRKKMKRKRLKNLRVAMIVNFNSM